MARPLALKSNSFMLHAFFNLINMMGFGAQLMGVTYLILRWHGGSMEESHMDIANAAALACIPFMFATQIGGRLADRFSRRKMAAGAYLAGLIDAAIFWQFEDPSLVWIQAQVFISSLLQGLGKSAINALHQDRLDHLVDREYIANIPRMMGMGWRIGKHQSQKTYKEIERYVFLSSQGVLNIVVGGGGLLGSLLGKEFWSPSGYPLIFLINALSYAPILGFVIWEGWQARRAYHRELLLMQTRPRSRFEELFPERGKRLGKTYIASLQGGVVDVQKEKVPFKEALSYLKERPLPLRAYCTYIMATVLLSNGQVLIPVLGLQVYGSKDVYGWLMAVSNLSWALVGMLEMWQKKKEPTFRSLLLAAAAQALLWIPFAVGQEPVLSMFAYVFYAYFCNVVYAWSKALLCAHAPRRLRGRLQALNSMVYSGGQALSCMLSAAIYTFWGVHWWTLVLPAIVQVLLVALLYFWSLYNQEVKARYLLVVNTLHFVREALGAHKTH